MVRLQVMRRATAATVERPNRRPYTIDLPRLNGLAPPLTSNFSFTPPFQRWLGGRIINPLIDALKGANKRAVNGTEVNVAHSIHARVTASVTELKRNPMGTIAAGNGAAVAILNRNEPAFYCVPADEYAAMLNLIEDAELNAIADARAGSPEIAVSLDDL